MKITGSLIVCGVAAAFTATTLLINPDVATPAPSAQASTAEITISQFAFSEATAAPGASVAVRNLDDTEHTATSASGEFDTRAIAIGGTATILAPTEPGVYEFVCNIHPSMRGRLSVTAP
jgi:plastocyanin